MTSALRLAPSPNLADPAVYTLVRQVYRARFRAWVKSFGLDPDDALQEVYAGIVSRSQGRSAWNPKRSALSTWIYMVTRCVLANFIDKTARQRKDLLGIEQDASGRLGAEAEGELLPRDLEDVAAELEVPLGVVEAFVDGRDAVVAALDAGWDAPSAVRLVEAMGGR